MYLGIFNDLGDVLQEFSHSYDHVDENMKDYNDINVLLAFYEYEDYSGWAFVLFERSTGIPPSHFNIGPKTLVNISFLIRNLAFTLITQ